MLAVFKNGQYLNELQITAIADDCRLSQEKRFYSGFYSKKLPINLNSCMYFFIMT